MGTYAKKHVALLVIASALISGAFCDVLYAQSDQERPKLFGVNTAMTSVEFEKELTSRGYDCSLFGASSWGSFCLEPQSAEEAFKLSSAVIEQENKAFQTQQSGKKAGYTDAQAQAILSILSFAPKALKPLKVVLRYERNAETTIVFSCAVFSSCDHEATEIVSALNAQTGLKEVSMEAYTPSIVEDLVSLARSDGNPSEDDLKGLSVVQSHAVFLPSLSPCLYNREADDEVCIYDGNLVLSFPVELVGSSILLESESAAKLVMGVPIDGEIFILKSGSKRGTGMTFN